MDRSVRARVDEAVGGEGAAVAIQCDTGNGVGNLEWGSCCGRCGGEIVCAVLISRVKGTVEAAKSGKKIGEGVR